MSDPTNPAKPDETLLDENNPGQVEEPQIEENEVHEENIQEQYQEGYTEEYQYPAEEENEVQQEEGQQNNEEEHNEDAGEQDIAEKDEEHPDEDQEVGDQEYPQQGESKGLSSGELLVQSNQEGQNVDIIPQQGAKEEYPNSVQYLSDGQYLQDGIENHYQSTSKLQNEEISLENHDELIEQSQSLPHEIEENQTQPEIQHQYINQQIHEQLRIDDIYLTNSELHGEKTKQVNPLIAQQISFIGLEQTSQPEKTSSIVQPPITSVVKQNLSPIKKEQVATVVQPEEVPPAFTVFVKKQVSQQSGQKSLIAQRKVDSPNKLVKSIEKTQQITEKPKQNVPQPSFKEQKVQIVKTRTSSSKMQTQIQPKPIAVVKQETKSQIKPVLQQQDKDISPPIVKKKKKKNKTHHESLKPESKVIRIEEKRETFNQKEKQMKEQTIHRQNKLQGTVQNRVNNSQSASFKKQPQAPIASPPAPPRESFPIAPAVPPPVLLNNQAIKEPGIEDHPPLTSLIIVKQAQKQRVGTTYNMFLKYNHDYDRAVNNYKRIVSSICLQLQRQKNSKKKLISLLTDYFVDYAKVNRQFHESVYKIQNIEQIPFSPNRFGNIKVQLKAHFEELIFLRKSIANDSHKIDVFITTQVLPNIKKVFETYYVSIGVEERRQIERRQHHYKREKVWRKLVSQLDKNFNRGMQGKQKEDIFADIIRFVNQQKIHRDALRNYGRGLIDLRQTYIRCEKELFDNLQYILNQFKTQSKTVYSVGRSIFDSIADITHEIQKMTRFSEICALTDLDYIKYVLQLHSKSSADDFRNKHFGMYLDLVFFDRVVGNIRDLYKGATNKIFPMEYQGDELIHTISGNLVHFNRDRDEFRDKFVIRNINVKIIGQGIVEFDQVVKGIIFDDNRTIRLRLKDADRAEELICYLNSKEENIVIDQPVSARS